MSGRARRGVRSGVVRHDRARRLRLGLTSGSHFATARAGRPGRARAPGSRSISRLSMRSPGRPGRAISTTEQRFGREIAVETDPTAIASAFKPFRSDYIGRRWRPTQRIHRAPVRSAADRRRRKTGPFARRAAPGSTSAAGSKAITVSRPTTRRTKATLRTAVDRGTEAAEHAEGNLGGVRLDDF